MMKASLRADFAGHAHAAHGRLSICGAPSEASGIGNRHDHDADLCGPSWRVNQRLATRMLEKRGHRVVLAGNGREALEALEKASFDLVLMNVQMPQMDRFQATAAIREKEMGTATHLPVIALTGHAIKGDRERCLAAGMDGYLTKPIRPRELDDVLESYLARRTEKKPEMAGSGRSGEFGE